MDPRSLVTPANVALAVVSFIGLQIASGGLKEIGKDIYGKVKESFKGDELIKLDLFEKYPESKELQNEVATALTKHLEVKPDLANEFEELLKQSKAAQIKRNTIEIKGDGNIAAQDVVGNVVIKR